MPSVFIEQPFFPSNKEDTIDTLEFLNAAKGIVWLIEQFGFGFELVKNDVLGNIKKLQKKYHENEWRCKCLKQLILCEHDKGEHYAIESLLWLRRGLCLLGKFLTLFLSQEKKGIRNENLNDLLREAYENTLKVHHGWGTRILFNILCNKCPSRSNLLKIIGSDINGMVDCNRLEEYCGLLLTNLEQLSQFYMKYNIKPHH